LVHVHRILVFVVLILLAAPNSVLASPQEDAKTLVQENYASIKKLVSASKNSEGLSKKITGVLDALIDWDSFSSKTLSTRTWGDLDAVKKASFKHSYRKLIVRRYAKRFKAGVDFRVEFREVATDAKSKGVWVYTTVHSNEGKRKLGIDVDYEFWKGEKGYRVADIVTDGVSRARSYRPKFKRILRDRGFDSLISAIERNAKRR
jgi:ABC-type transporter MlaC component